MFVRPPFALVHNTTESLAKELLELRKLAKDLRAASLRRTRRLVAGLQGANKARALVLEDRPVVPSSLAL
jgi:hypothetical protein